MSFNPTDNNHSLISRNNYEEYFLLYADNELTEAERVQVEQFIITHPDLQHELDLLLSTKLPLEQVSMNDKESLLAHNMQLNTVDEALLLYIDNELSGPEKIRVEQKLKNDEAYHLQYKTFLQTKPSPEVISYPYKKELYRHEEKKGFPVYWIRIAAAIVILLGMGIFIYTNQQNSVVPVAEVSEKTETGKEPVSGEATKTNVAIDTRTTTELQPPVIKTGTTDDVPNVVRNIKKKPQEKEIKKQITPSIEIEPEVFTRNEAKEKPTENKNLAVNNRQEASPKQTINKPDVTLPSIASFDNHTTPAVTAVQTDVVKMDNEKKSTLKGFLRKATRFIERRTNISTTNEGDELLIGAVALKL